jgi:hypothetical protein
LERRKTYFNIRGSGRVLKLFSQVAVPRY